MSLNLDAMWKASIRADQAFSAALTRTYGADACNARYDARGTATPELASLFKAKADTYCAYAAAAYPHRAV